jgi:2-polyprenyl-3-methyl-5-hydroxy-6-metoxy-1,4-benzoquinol methylase
LFTKFATIFYVKQKIYRVQKIRPKIYNKKYFDSERCEGFAEYKKNKLSPVKIIEISLLNLRKKDRVLDVGCGRGDIPHYLSKRGYDIWATDYSNDAVEITQKRVTSKHRKQVFLCDARKQVIKNTIFDKIVVGDVIEHMTFKDALRLVNNTYLELADGGILVVHTSPNVWFKKYIYPLTKIAFKIMRFEKVVSMLDENIEGTHHYHIDEYSPLSLFKLMKKSKFKKFKVWVNRDAVRESSTNYLDPIKKSALLKACIWSINNSPLIYLFGNDLFVVAQK